MKNRIIIPGKQFAVSLITSFIFISSFLLASCNGIPAKAEKSVAQVSIVPSPKPKPVATVKPMMTPMPKPSDASVAQPSLLPLPASANVKAAGIPETLVPPDAYFRYKDSIPIDRGYFFAEHYETYGEEFDYCVFKFVEPEFDEYGRTEIMDGYFSDPKEMYWVVVVLSDGEVFDVLRMNRAEHLSAIPETSKIVKEVDVNFDGSKDIALWTGHYGSRGAVTYECYLYMSGKLVECDSFANIPNPVADAEKQVIYGDSIYGGGGRGWVVYRYINDEFVPVERFTISNSDTEISVAADCGAAYRYAFCYTIEAFINGNWQITDYFTEADNNAEALYDEKINGENSYWNILDDFGKMREISLYSRD